ncbi:hypothetical protein [Paraburkholderia xenovorans]
MFEPFVQSALKREYRLNLPPLPSSGKASEVTISGSHLGIRLKNGKNPPDWLLRPGLFEDRRGMFVSRTSGTNF